MSNKYSVYLNGEIYKSGLEKKELELKDLDELTEYNVCVSSYNSKEESEKECAKFKTLKKIILSQKLIAKPESMSLPIGGENMLKHSNYKDFMPPYSPKNSNIEILESNNSLKVKNVTKGNVSSISNLSKFKRDMKSGSYTFFIEMDVVGKLEYLRYYPSKEFNYGVLTEVEKGIYRASFKLDENLSVDFANSINFMSKEDAVIDVKNIMLLEGENLSYSSMYPSYDSSIFDSYNWKNKVSFSFLPEDTTDKTVNVSGKGVEVHKINDKDFLLWKKDDGKLKVTAVSGDSNSSVTIEINPIIANQVILDKKNMYLEVGDIESVDFRLLPRGSENVGDVVLTKPKNDKCINILDGLNIEACTPTESLRVVLDGSKIDGKKHELEINIKPQDNKLNIDESQDFGGVKNG